MIRMNIRVAIIPLVLLSVAVGTADDNSRFAPLFPQDGVPKGWLVRRWNDVRKPADAATTWRVENGILHGSEPRGTWLLSEKEYGDFILEFERAIGFQELSRAGGHVQVRNARINVLG